MRFNPELADIRFGCGLSAHIPSPDGVNQMLATLEQPDAIAARFRIESFETFQKRITHFQALRKLQRKNRGTPEETAAKKAGRALNKHAREAQAVWLGQHLNRWIWTDAPLRERLAAFWADHFTATGKAGLLRRIASPYVQDAIRPRIAGRFEDMLIHAVLHPVMIHYLDQHRSIGPNSLRASNGGALSGLNENLAREVLELHTLGVGGPYTQDDVRELAELLTGVTIAAPLRLRYRKDSAEPGAETVLGQTYGGDTPRLRDVKDVLRDLARHPATARHLAFKLAVHFVSDRPDPALVDALAQRYLDTQGDLGEVTAALLHHPAAWMPARRNVKPAFQFIGSALRALAVPPDVLPKLSERLARRLLVVPLRQMGHPWENPQGPDGLPEADTAWIDPQGLAARLQWVMAAPQHLLDAPPDPRIFVRTALGTTAPEAVTFAANAAESRWDGIGLVLASPAFQRS